MAPTGADLLAALTAHRWVSPATLAVGEARHGPQGLSIGSVTYGPGTHVTVEGDQLSVLHEGWRLDLYRRYRPLIYFAAYGDAASFACVELAIQSLWTHGGYDGDVLLLTDRPLPPSLEGRVQMRHVPGADMLDWTLTRYRLVEMAEFAAWGPVLYLDTDMVCNAPLDGLLRRLACSHFVHAPVENALNRPEDWYGITLLEADGVRVPPERMGFTTGMMGFPTLATARPFFTSVRRVAEGYAQATGKRSWGGRFDQRFANYASAKGFPVEMRLLPPFLDNLHYWHPRPATRRGLTHFTGGVDAPREKLAAMAAYLEQLRPA